MALGHYDAMGVWVYGEDDEFVNASSWLNKLGQSLSAAVKRQYDVNTAPTDEAVAALFGTPGSATRAAAGVTETAFAMAQLDTRVDVLEPLTAGDVERTAFVPVFTNMALGSGSSVLFAEYSVTKGRCHGTVLIRLGTGRPTTTTYRNGPCRPLRLSSIRSCPLARPCSLTCQPTCGSPACSTWATRPTVCGSRS
jgi:hypothetical protein